jgi:hypothetical protein
MYRVQVVTEDSASYYQDKNIESIINVFEEMKINCENCV